MKRLFFAATALALLMPSLAMADEFKAESKIVSATVYTGRAKVTRVAEIDLPAGAHTVVFTGLPAILLPDSLRAEGSARADVKFGAVAHKQIMSSQLTSARENELNAELEKLQDQVTLLNSEKNALTAQRTFIQALGTQANLRSDEEIAELNLKPDQWSAAGQTIRNDLAETLKGEVMLDIRLREANRDITRVRGELDAQRTDQRSTWSVTVPLESTEATKLKIELSYQVPNATWTPIYDARLETEGQGDLKLQQFGSVQQTTGEDWEDIALALSTAQPQRGTGLPDLQPNWVDAYERGQVVGTNRVDSATTFDGGGPGSQMQFKSMSSNIVQASSGFGGIMGGAAMEAAPPPPVERKAEFAAALANNSGFVSEYKIPGPSRVMSDGTETKLMVGGFDLDSKLEVHIKPQLSTEAYLVAKSKLKGESPILPGQVNLFRDGAFIGQSRLPLLRPGEEQQLYFGVDDQVAVKRKTLKDERKEAGIISRDNILDRHFVTEIQNLHTKKVDIVVKETVPAPRNEKVRVEISKENTTTGYTEDTANIKGMTVWQFPMEAKEKKELKLGWTLTWPSGTTLSGL
ncbi:MAG: mucoidy inhibitor MuiA family protein [Alphaproteobacteria bacterium]